MRTLIKNFLSSIQDCFRFIHLAATNMPGQITFNQQLSQDSTHGHIYVSSADPSQRAIKIAFQCENGLAPQSFLPHTQEEIVRQARLAGFEPIYLSCYDSRGHHRERSIDFMFGL